MAKKLVAYRLDTDLLDRMATYKDRVGVPESEQVRRALREWLDKHEPERKKARKP